MNARPRTPYLVEHLYIHQLYGITGTAENHRQFEEAMKHGHIKAWLCKLLMYGAAGSGKTTSKEIIIGNKPPKDRAHPTSYEAYHSVPSQPRL